MADDVLRQGVQGITDLITVPGLVNLDFADVRTIMTDAGSALMGIGAASGENRAAEAARAAVSSPLLEASIEGATGILLNITGGAGHRPVRGERGGRGRHERGRRERERHLRRGDRRGEGRRGHGDGDRDRLRRGPAATAACRDAVDPRATSRSRPARSGSRAPRTSSTSRASCATSSATLERRTHLSELLVVFTRIFAQRATISRRGLGPRGFGHKRLALIGSTPQLTQRPGPAAPVVSRAKRGMAGAAPISGRFRRAVSARRRTG